MATKKKEPLYVWSDTPTFENISSTYVTSGEALSDAVNECCLGDSVTIFQLVPVGTYTLDARWGKTA
jgi:hypothetical protein